MVDRLPLAYHAVEEGEGVLVLDRHVAVPDDTERALVGAPDGGLYAVHLALHQARAREDRLQVYPPG